MKTLLFRYSHGGSWTIRIVHCKSATWRRPIGLCRPTVRYKLTSSHRVFSAAWRIRSDRLRSFDDMSTILSDNLTEIVKQKRNDHCICETLIPGCNVSIGTKWLYAYGTKVGLYANRKKGVRRLLDQQQICYIDTAAMTIINILRRFQ